MIEITSARQQVNIRSNKAKLPKTKPLDRGEVGGESKRMMCDWLMMLLMRKKIGAW
jgi:hypothetical protein